ncbi:hypothetical protein AADZ91_10450 [Colwelliaceae bacterium 6441]
MQIQSANSYTPQSVQLVGADNQGRVNEQRDRLLVLQEQAKTQQESPQKNPQERLDIDPQAIALVEQDQQLRTKQNAEKNNQNSVQADYDQPPQKNNTAVSTYQSVGNIAQRDTIQQAFGVDVYA